MTETNSESSPPIIDMGEMRRLTLIDELDGHLIPPLGIDMRHMRQLTGGNPIFSRGVACERRDVNSDMSAVYSDIMTRMMYGSATEEEVEVMDNLLRSMMSSDDEDSLSSEEDWSAHFVTQMMNGSAEEEDVEMLIHLLRSVESSDDEDEEDDTENLMPSLLVISEITDDISSMFEDDPEDLPSSEGEDDLPPLVDDIDSELEDDLPPLEYRRLETCFICQTEKPVFAKIHFSTDIHDSFIATNAPQWSCDRCLEDVEDRIGTIVNCDRDYESGILVHTYFE